jgi:two-component system NtrC family response regulator
LQEKKFRPIGSKKEIESDFRLVSATHRDLQEMVNKGDFREDFYFRISVIKINIPPLRDRKTDIPLLVQDLLEQHCTPEQGIIYEASTAFIKEFLMYDWPGNVRELISALAYACADCYGGGQLVPMHLPDQIRTANINKKITTDDVPDPSTDLKTEQIHFDQMPLKAFIEEMKEKYLTQLLLHTQGNIQEACRLSGLSRGHLYSLLKKYKKPLD